ncbi:unnamed protein product [Sympodiomycopsis kandeliae]
MAAASSSSSSSTSPSQDEFVFYVTRHGHRMQWRGNELNLSPTGRPRDPVLTAHGVDQVKQMAQWFKELPKEQQPQMIVSSPYYRCVQTAGPTAEALDLDIHIEPGLSEWFPPANAGTGKHPVPMRAATVSQYAPRVAPVSAWSPLVYPLRRGETIEEIHWRTRRVAQLIEDRCRSRGITKVLLVSHAATIIAFGRGLLEPAGKETTDWSTGEGIEIGAGTSSLSLYVKGQDSKQAFETFQGKSISDSVNGNGWNQIWNGSALHLSGGVEREWTYRDIPGNVEEPGMGVNCQDEEALEEEEMIRLEKAGQYRDQQLPTRANL